MEAYLDIITEYAANYGIFFIVPYLFLENVPFIGFIAPGVTILFLSGFLSDVLPGGILGIGLVAYLTIIVADSCWYWLGYWSEGKWRSLQKITSKSPNVGELLTTQPKKVLIFYQFIPYFRMFLPFALGAYRYPARNWLLLTLIGSFLYTAVYIGLGCLAITYLGGLENSSAVLKTLTVIITIVSIVYGIYLVTKYIRLKKNNRTL